MNECGYCVKDDARFIVSAPAGPETEVLTCGAHLTMGVDEVMFDLRALFVAVSAIPENVTPQ